MLSSEKMILFSIMFHALRIRKKKKKKKVQKREVYSQWKICVLQTVLSDTARLVIFFSA